MATITDIAKVANVSTATVSRVLNSPESVSAERRERVLHAIEALNYTPNANARDLVTKSTHVIGILLPDVSNTYSPAVINTFLQKTSEFGYNSLIAITNADDQKEHDYLQMMLTRRVEGLFLLGSRKRQSANNELLNQIALRTPVVMSDYLDLKNVSHVMTDEEHGAYLATQYLINLGHTRIGFVHGPLSMTTNYYKRQGYLRAMQEPCSVLSGTVSDYGFTGFHGRISGNESISAVQPSSHCYFLFRRSDCNRRVSLCA